MSEAFIVDALRTPIGRHRGALAAVRPDDLAATVLAEVVRRNEVRPDSIEDVYFGCTNGVGEDSRNVARMAVLLAGLPHSVPGATINRLCASGMEAVIAAARSIRCGEGETLVAGGVESMSRAPWAILKPERAQPVGAPEVADTTIGWRFVNPRMSQLASIESMGETAENVATAFGVGRAAQDELALGSHRRAVHAAEDGRLEPELIAVQTPSRHDPAAVVTRDEAPRSETTLEALASLRPAFREGGSVTAGNSSPLNDGAAALLLCGEAGVERLARAPLARFLASAAVGVDPGMMGIGPVPAIRLALARAALDLGDVAVFELNEAFASQAIACVEELGLDPAKVNPNGGAIALGHPLGMTGARIVGALAWELRQRRERYGVAAMCVGVGQGVAVVLENPDAV